MDLEKFEIIKNGKGFIAALDQSGGSSAKTLELYGIGKNEYHGDCEMFNLIHDMRTRIIKSTSFTNQKILGVILFEETMNRKIEDLYTADYLWNRKKIVPFLKVDKGLEKEKDGVQLMKPIPNLLDTLDLVRNKNIFGTKMRSVISSDNRVGIEKIVEQQFVLAKTICSKGLVPIIEPEVSITSPVKEKCEVILKEIILKKLNELDDDEKVMFKFSIPTIPNFYQEIINHKNVVRVVALSGGYSKSDACLKLSENNNMIASFSRALLEGLKVSDTQSEFDLKLEKSINDIYEASIK